MGGTFDRGIPSEDVAISIAIDQLQYDENGWRGSREPMRRQKVRVVREPCDGDETDRPNVYFSQSYEDDPEADREDFVRINPETRRDCCGCRPRYCMAE